MFFKEFRDRLGISQKEAFEKLEIQQATLAKYESQSIAPSSSVIKKYCETLNANPTFLFFGQEPHLLSATPQISIENGYLLNDLSSLFSQDELANKLREILIEALLKRVQGIIKEGTFVKLLDAFSLGSHVRQRPFLFMYYVFQIISVAKNQPNTTIQNAKQFIIETIQNFKTFSWKNQPAFTEKIKQDITELIDSDFTESECQLLIEQTDTVLILLERSMSPMVIKAHRGVFHA